MKVVTVVEKVVTVVRLRSVRSLVRNCDPVRCKNIRGFLRAG